MKTGLFVRRVEDGPLVKGIRHSRSPGFERAEREKPGRRLQEHFHRFIGEPPSVYGLRLRLNGVRRELQRLFNTDPIAEIALGYGFPHPARFGQQYRRLFGETASATRRKTIAHIASPAPRADRPEIAILPFQAPLELSGLAGLLADSLAAALSGEAAIRRPSLNAAFRPSRDIDVQQRLMIFHHPTPDASAEWQCEQDCDDNWRRNQRAAVIADPTANAAMHAT